MGSIYRRKNCGQNWHASYVSHTGKTIQRSTKTSVKKLALQILEHWESQEIKRRSGLVDPRAERLTSQTQRPIAEHVAEYRAKMEAAGNSAKYVSQTIGEINAVVEDCGAEVITDLTPEKVEAYLAKLLPTADAKGRSPRKIGSVVQSCKGFAKWCYRSGRVSYHTLEVLSKPSTQRDRRLKRRPLTREEFARLIASVKGDAFGMEETARVLVYSLAVQTGLRSNELRSLQVSDIHFTSPPFVRVVYGAAKNKQNARQFITSSLAQQLQKHTKGRSGKVFEMPPDWQVVDMLRHDLDAAGIPHEDEAGQQVDFHALRHTCGTWLAQANVGPKAIQQIMRHSDIRLTIETYGHLFPNDEASAIARTFGDHAPCVRKQAIPRKRRNVHAKDRGSLANGVP